MSEQQVQKIYRVTDDAIIGFFKEHRFLSNFHECGIEYEGLTYRSTEAAYQAAKIYIPEDAECTNLRRAKFTCLTASKAKVEGRNVQLRDDWEERKVGIMLMLNISKFLYHEDLKKLLLETGDKHLEEANWWGDDTWGTVDGKGRNLLGEILMLVRSNIRDIERLKIIPPLIRNH